MRAEAVAVANGKILAVGRRSDVMKLKGPQTQLVDLEGPDPRPRLCRRPRPHRHRWPAGALRQPAGPARRQGDGHRLAAADAARLGPEERRHRRKDEGHHRLRLRQLPAQGTAPPDQGRTGRGLQDIPVIIIHQSSHLATVNSAMLKAMGYDASSKDPAGGVIQRKPGTTEPNGTLEETAFFNGAPVVLGRVGPEGLKIFAREGAKLWARFGYTTAQEGRCLAPGRRHDEAGGCRRRLRERRDHLSRRAGRPRLHQGQPERHLHQPLPRRGRQAHHRRQPAGLHRLARPALLQAGRQLSAGLLRLCRGVRRAGHGRRAVGRRERHPDHHPRQWRARLRPADRRPPGGAGALPAGQGAAPRAHPRPVPARGPARQLQGAGRHPLAVPDAHLLLGRLAPRPHRRPAGGHEHLAHRLGAASAA